MPKVKMLKLYARLICEIGLNASNKQDVFIEANVEHHEFVKYLVSELYNSYNVKKVSVHYYDNNVLKLNLINMSDTKLLKYDQFDIAKYKQMTESRNSLLVLKGGEVGYLSKVKFEKKKLYFQTQAEAIGKYTDIYFNNEITFCETPIPTKEWAVKVYPNLTPSQAIETLWNDVFKMANLKDNSSIKEMKSNLLRNERIAKYLNSLNFSKVHVYDNNGTDFTFNIPSDGIFNCSYLPENVTGHLFCSSIPSNFIFIAPHKDKIDGTIKSSSPITSHGECFDEVSIKLEKGNIVDIESSSNIESLKSYLLETTSLHKIGSICFSPFNKELVNAESYYENTLDYYNRSFISFGKAKKESIRDGHDIPEIELLNLGLSQEGMQISFPFGNKNTCIDLINDDGEVTTIFKNGQYIIDESEIERKRYIL